MALSFCDGFDDGLAASKWIAGTGNTYPAGRNGNCALLAASSTNSLKRAILPGASTLIVGFACKVTILSNGAMLSLQADGGATTHAALRLEANGTITVRRGVGGGATVLATSSVGLNANNWYYVELKATIADAGGIVELRIDGKTVATYTGDTREGGTATDFDTVYFHGNGGAFALAFCVDDVYICDTTGTANNDFLGDIKIETLYPSGNGNSSQLVGSDADSVDNYQLVDEVVPSTTDYVTSGTVGNKDTYTFSNLSTATGPIKGVQVTSYANKTDVGTRDLINITRSGAVEADSVSVPLQTTYGAHSSVRELDPNTSTAWTIASVNAAEFGVKVN